MATKTPAAGAAPNSAGAPAKAASRTPTKVGVVESDARAKTRKVVVRDVMRHGKYGKYLKTRTVLHVHDERNESRTGDVVEVAECRPISKTKAWKLVRIVEKRSAEAAALKSAAEIGSVTPA